MYMYKLYIVFIFSVLEWLKMDCDFYLEILESYVMQVVKGSNYFMMFM